ncbi:MAG: DUF370 domain-containing protein [Methanocorpusculum sp.]|nr:DUF370 domain-containing protein [Methanocorpusculum sp.]
MYIHLGNNHIISAQNVIAILNMEPPLSEDLKDIIDSAKLDKKLINISEKGKEKALIVCDNKVYLSPISSTTLYKRAFSHYKEV